MWLLFWRDSITFSSLHQSNCKITEAIIIYCNLFFHCCLFPPLFLCCALFMQNLSNMIAALAFSISMQPRWPLWPTAFMCKGLETLYVYILFTLLRFHPVLRLILLKFWKDKHWVCSYLSAQKYNPTGKTEKFQDFIKFC